MVWVEQAKFLWQVQGWGAEGSNLRWRRTLRLDTSARSELHYQDFNCEKYDVIAFTDLLIASVKKDLYFIYEYLYKILRDSILIGYSN